MLPYNKNNPVEIESFAKNLIGKTFRQVIDASKDWEWAIKDSKIDYENPDMKGNLGTLLEELYFGYKANSIQEADFPEAGVELKVTCYDVLKNGNISAGERLVLTMVSYEKPIESDFYKSDVWHKCRLILLIYYERNRLLAHNTQYKISYANLISPAKKDIPVILEDYRTIVDIIKNGKAEELSESMTHYIGACTKGATALKSMRPQYYSPHTSARKRAFCFKRQYMDYVLNTYIVLGKTKYEPVISEEELISRTFEEAIIDKINKYVGKTDKELCNIFNRPYNNNKAQWTDLSYRMLGIKGNHAEEFQKANIVVKVARLEENSTMKESISFPPIKFKELIKEDWEESAVYDYFSETRFFFVVYRRYGEFYRLSHCKFWAMPYKDLNVTVKREWQRIHNAICNGVTFSLKKQRNGFIVTNNLPGMTDGEILHIRPHAKKRAYKLKNGFEIGDVNKDSSELPNGEYMTTQSFWVNNSYIEHQII